MSVLLLGEGNDELKLRLRQLGHTVFETPRISSLDARVSAHADLCACSPRPGMVILAPSARKLGEELTNLGYRVDYISEDPASPYPDDICLNASVFGDRLLCRLDSVSPEFKSLFGADKMINTRQGYARCSCIPIASDAAITSDPDIREVLTRNGFSVLLVTQNGIELEGFSEGFFGGCCGMVSDTEIAFTGSLDMYPDGDKVRSFLASYNIGCVELSHGALRDIGSIIWLKGEKE